jgi:hypothetical protein
VQLDLAAPLLADGEPPIVVGKINADMYRSAVEKYDIRCTPMLILQNSYKISLEIFLGLLKVEAMYLLDF